MINSQVHWRVAHSLTGSAVDRDNLLSLTNISTRFLARLFLFRIWLSLAYMYCTCSYSHMILLLAVNGCSLKTVENLWLKRYMYRESDDQNRLSKLWDQKQTRRNEVCKVDLAFQAKKRSMIESPLLKAVMSLAQYGDYECSFVKFIINMHTRYNIFLGKHSSQGKFLRWWLAIKDWAI